MRCHCPTLFLLVSVLCNIVECSVATVVRCPLPIWHGGRASWLQLTCVEIDLTLWQFGFECFQIVPAKDAAFMAVAKPWADAVVALEVPALNRDAGELFRPIAAVLIAEDVLLADVLRAGRMLAEELGREVALAAVLPKDAEFTADEL